MGRESVAIVGRNGMGKTTLCNAIMGIRPPEVSGSIRFEGQELVGRASYRIAAGGIGYVPQGRRLFPSLTVDEHLRMIRAPGSLRWTPDRIYELFPRTASDTAARSFPAGSSRCSPSAVLCSRTQSS